MSTVPAIVRKHVRSRNGQRPIAVRIEKVISCITDILRSEEDTCCATEPMLEDILVVLESGRSNQELKAVFTGNQS